MLFTKTSSAVEWKAVASAIKTLVEEATFEASSEALIFRAMDPSHIALVDLMWPAVAFEKYECDKPFKFSIRVEDFVKLIGRTDSKDSIESGVHRRRRSPVEADERLQEGVQDSPD